MGEAQTLERLVAIMHRLRSPGGCPWDAEQTHQTLAPYLIEECYEVLEALDQGDDGELCEELGDVLLQVVFHSELGSERGAFTIDEVIGRLSDKLVRRHPHVFADTVVGSTREVISNWSRIKRAEKAEGTAVPSVLTGVPKALPALLRAHRIGERASEAGFDWTDAHGARQKISEELDEVDRADQGQGSLADEIGDLLFAVVSYARLSGFNAELLLQAALERFRTRFGKMEGAITDSGRDIHDLEPDELERLWRQHRAESA